MSPDDPRLLRLLLFMLCAGLLGLLAAALWVLYAHPFTILIFGPLRLSASLRRLLRRLLRSFETLVARAFDKSPAASLPESKVGRRVRR
jgi:UDP-N-acetylmuramyl pentapeptide phosphotransferase/UDP-N-acetylglucosamine-1-phosphate transferase